MKEQETLGCGHKVKFRYFIPGVGWRCCACDDPYGKTVAMQKFIKQGLINPIKEMKVL